MQRRHRTDFTLRIVGRHLHAERLRDRSDLFQLQDAAGVANIRLDVVDQVARAELHEAVLGKRALARR